MFILQLSNVKLEDTGPTDKYVAASQKEEFRTALQKHCLRFSFQDGIIDQLCPSEGEAVWVLNIKRGILSSLQNSMKFIDDRYTHTYEVDNTILHFLIFYFIFLVHFTKSMVQHITKRKEKENTALKYI